MDNNIFRDEGYPEMAYRDFGGKKSRLPLVLLLVALTLVGLMFLGNYVVGQIV
jgi:hypothetical protein